uniref:ORF-c protein n=1 Tax=Brassica campestris TaxID=3711 RepID=Q9ST09_BRACM|nr:ORF-c [Brassica rapa]
MVSLLKPFYVRVVHNSLFLVLNVLNLQVWVKTDHLREKKERNGTATFIQSIQIPQGPKAVLFAQCQEAARKDVERAFGVLQARFAIVKNPALFWDKVKIGNIMRVCIILHNMIVEDERDGYTHLNVSEFQHGEDAGSSHVDLTYSTDMPSNIANMMGVRTRIRDKQMHQRLKADLIEHIWRKFGGDEDNN